ncbi:MAG: CPBP family intramembrane metalloprotease [Parcubacteria group bacterium]|nr:CPBP family intramembrane metalloprotease [Parcubacteria group bacterium]
MEKLLTWLKEEARGKHLYLLMLGAIFFNIIWVFMGTWIISDFLLLYIPPARESNIPIFTWYFPFILFWGALWEEIIFRFPLDIIADICDKDGRILYAIIISSLMFGYLHGGILYILFQGVFGFILCLLFLKSGGFQNNPYKALLVTTSTHFGNNALVAGSHCPKWWNKILKKGGVSWRKKQEEQKLKKEHRQKNGDL